MVKKTSVKTPKGEQTRTVYEVLAPHLGTRRLEAGTTTELRDALSRLLPELEPYAVQAVARLASIERATVTAIGWSVRRVGVMQFQPDDFGQPPAKTGGRLRKSSPVEGGKDSVTEPLADQPESEKPSTLPELRPAAAPSRPIADPHHDGRLLSVD